MIRLLKTILNLKTTSLLKSKNYWIIMDLGTLLFIVCIPFVLLTAYFGTKNDFYESDNYKGDGCAHDVKR